LFVFSSALFDVSADLLSEDVQGMIIERAFCLAVSPSQVIFGGVNAAAVGLVFSAVYLLWEKTLSIGYGGVQQTFSVSTNPLYVSVVGCAFVAVGMFNVPAPAAIIAGGVVGLLDYAAASS
jgi:chromate transport protein ChrA